MAGDAVGRGRTVGVVGCTVSPGFEFEDYEAGERAMLCQSWPEFAEEISALTHG